MKFGAHYMLSPLGEFVKWPLISMSTDGLISEVESFPGGFVEKPGVRFFSGILSPAFIDLRSWNGIVPGKFGSRFLNRHFKDGTLVLGHPLSSDMAFPSRKSWPVFSPFSGGGDQKLPFVSSDVSVTLWDIIKLVSANNDDREAGSLLKLITTDAAHSIGSRLLGQLSPGFSPGLLLLQNADLNNLEVRSQTNVKWLNVPDCSMHGFE
jgi:hypothetical protein